MHEQMRTLVLVLAARAAPYPLLIRTIKRTWARDRPERTDVLFYFGGAEIAERGDELEVPVADDLENAGRKTLSCFAHVLETRDFDIVFRTNCSSYVDLPNLERYVATSASAERFYAGWLGTWDGVEFASGAGYFLSRDLVELAVRKERLWDHRRLDDVALAELLARESVSPKPAPRVDYTHVDEARRVDVSQFHFRCKTETRWRLGDMAIMAKLDRAFAAARRRRGRGRLPMWPELAWSSYRAAARVRSVTRPRR